MSRNLVADPRVPFRLVSDHRKYRILTPSRARAVESSYLMKIYGIYGRYADFQSGGRIAPYYSMSSVVQTLQKIP